MEQTRNCMKKVESRQCTIDNKNETYHDVSFKQLLRRIMQCRYVHNDLSFTQPITMGPEGSKQVFRAPLSATYSVPHGASRVLWRRSESSATAAVQRSHKTSRVSIQFLNAGSKTSQDTVCSATELSGKSS